MKLSRTGVVVAFLLVLAFANVAMGQSLTSGDIMGRITDPTGAVVPNATVNLKSLDTGTVQSTTTNGEGSYRFNLLKPGRYEISTAVPGFAKIIHNVTVEVGQSTQVGFALEISKTAETIEVSTEAPLISTDPGTATSFTPTEVALLPAPGGDLSTIAFTAPGVVVAPGTGYGNFTANGLPGTSNLFTVNGENDMDPYFNINNTGATNLTLGGNEVEEVTVTTNPYAGQYGQLMGAQVSYVTKSGTNAFHGNAQYWWNGRYLNANNWFNNATSTPRSFANANQWAAAIGGPVVKDKLWFFVDTEGLRFVLPNVDNNIVPTPAFASAVLANIQTTQPNELQTYQTMMGYYAGALSGKTPFSVTQSKGCVAGVVPGWQAGAPCSEGVITTPTTLATEWILAGRVDYKLTSKDDIFFRFKIDHGTQPTTLDALNSLFNTSSKQPAYDYQAQDRHVFSSTMTNSFTASLSHYVALFSNPNQSKVDSVFPYALTFAANLDYTPVNGLGYAFPQGRNITQYQFIDDFSWTKGKHSLQFGVNFRRYDVSDHNFEFVTPLVYFRNIAGDNGLADFADGVAFQYRRAYHPSNNVPVALWGMGLYASDTWRMRSNFSLTLALRVERNSNPVCQKDCFSNFIGNGSFADIASVQAAAAGQDPGAVPYSSDVKYNAHQAYPGVDTAVVSPRIAFSWAPGKSDHFPWFPGGGKTVISGGIGIFYDNPAASLVDNELGFPGNPPNSLQFRIRPSTGTLPFDTTAAGSATTYMAAASAFSMTKSYNQIEQELKAINVVFPAPTFDQITGTVHAPQAQEWNLKIDQQIGRTTALTVNYAGNHVIRLPFANSFYNAYDANGYFPGVPGINPAPVVPNYGTVTGTQSGAVANYNGVTFSVREQFGKLILAHVNYTYSHTLDEVSNGGLNPYSGNPVATSSILEQLTPYGIRGNYGNAEYDIRHLFSGDFVVSPTFHFENKFATGLLNGWQWSGKVFLRTGYPFPVVDGNLAGVLVNYGGNILANQISAAAQTSCGKSNVNVNATPVPCLNANAFTNTGSATFPGYSAWPSQERNQFRGAHYFDMDMSLYKTFSIKEKASLGIGITAYNAFNHPNFGLPDNNLGDSNFGQITQMQGVPASPYGNFLNFDSSPRVVQLTAKFTF